VQDFGHGDDSGAGNNDGDYPSAATVAQSGGGAVIDKEHKMSPEEHEEEPWRNQGNIGWKAMPVRKGGHVGSLALVRVFVSFGLRGSSFFPSACRIF
jgi:hypothetical protein